jgi:two-component system sensor histidine kinase HydH
VPIIDEMGRQLVRIQHALQDLLTFARPSAPTLAPVSANAVVERAIRLVQSAADRAGVALESNLDTRAPRFTADEDMIHQALVNVLMNAVQATPSGGRVTITTRPIADDDSLEIEIADTGRGMSSEEQEQVFRPFFTTRHTGTGLGLPINVRLSSATAAPSGCRARRVRERRSRSDYRSTPQWPWRTFRR